MRRSSAHATATACTALACAAWACAALLTAPAAAQSPPIALLPGIPLPSVVPLPPLPPLPKEGSPVLATTQSVGRMAAPAAPARIDPSGRAMLDSGQLAVVARVNAYFNSLTTLVGNFVQVGPDRSRTEGEFYLQKPGRVRFEYDPPSPVQLIADGKTVAVRDRRLATQDVFPLSQTPLRFLLAERLDLLKDANVVGAHQDDLFLTVVIEERHPVVGTHRLMIMLGAADSELKQWTITDPQGFDTTIAVFNLDRTRSPDPSLFRIEFLRDF